MCPEKECSGILREEVNSYKCDKCNQEVLDEADWWQKANWYDDMCINVFARDAEKELKRRENLATMTQAREMLAEMGIYPVVFK
jgi:hypothetical protein